MRYSFTDIHDSGWAAATAAPGGSIAPVDPYYNVMEYSSSAINVSGRQTFVAIKPQGATLFRQIAIPLQARQGPMTPVNLRLR